MSTPPKPPATVSRELDASVGGFVLGSSRIRSDTMGSSASGRGSGRVRSDSGRTRVRSDTSMSAASAGKGTLEFPSLGIPFQGNRMRSTTAVKRHNVEYDRMNSSLSNSMSGDEDNLRDLMSEINLPMPKEDPLSTPSMSRCSSRRRIERKYSVASEMEEGIGEALQQLSHSIALTRGPSNPNLSPKQSLHRLKKLNSVTSHQSHLGNTIPSSNLIPGIPVVSEDICSPSSSAYQRTSSPTEASSCFEEEQFADAESTDVPELQKALKYRFEQLIEAVEMGQKLFMELGGVRDELNLALEDREHLLTENEARVKELEEFKRYNKKVIDQLRDAQSKITELDYVHAQQEEKFQEVQMEREQEKEELQKKQEDLIENAKWQEEKFVAVQEIALKQKPNNESIVKMKAAIHEGFIRKAYFGKLRLWMSNNKKKRWCFTILRANSRSADAQQGILVDMYFARLLSVGIKAKQRKRDELRAIEDLESENRNLFLTNAMDELSSAYLDFTLTTTEAWHISVREGEDIQSGLITDLKNTGELTTMALAETKWRKDILTQFWEAVCALYSTSCRETIDEWVSATQEISVKNGEITRIRSQWHSETSDLRKAYSAKDHEADTLTYKVGEGEKRIMVLATTIKMHETEIEKLRRDKLESSEEVVRLRESLEKACAELANARGQLEFQHSRAKSRANASQGGSAVSPCIRSALDLVHKLKKKTEDISENSLLSPRSSPLGDRMNYVTPPKSYHPRFVATSS